MSDGTASAYQGFNHAAGAGACVTVRVCAAQRVVTREEQIERSVVVSGGERANQSPVPAAKMTVMTKPETALIADSWDLVAQDLKGHGLKFFKQ